MSLLRRFVQCDRGGTAIEYGLIAALIGLGIIASLTNVKDAFGTNVNMVVNGMTGR